MLTRMVSVDIIDSMKTANIQTLWSLAACEAIDNLADFDWLPELGYSRETTCSMWAVQV